MPEHYAHPAWIEVDLGQFKKNIFIIRQMIGSRRLCLPIKANAYGHGLIPIAKAAIEAGVDYLAVAHSQEGVQLRYAGITAPILVLGAIHAEQIPDLLAHNLEFTIASPYKAELVAKYAQEHQARCRIHIELETGMQRTGIRPEGLPSLLDDIDSRECFEVVGLYSHLACADNPGDPRTQAQIDLFKTYLDPVRARYPNLIGHIANSGAVCHFPESYFDMVRPGLLAFGYYPQAQTHLVQQIAPFFSIHAKVAFFKVVTKDQGISYGHTYITHKQTRIITIPVGYGDGYRRALSNCGHVLLRGKKYPIVGTICMDQFMVDIGHDEAYIGDEVVLIGRQELDAISLESIATQCNTIAYEILCGFNNRLPRVYYD